MQVPRIPFKFLVMSSFLPEGLPAWTASPIDVERLEIDQAIDALQPTFTVPVSRKWYPPENLKIKIRKLKDFHPDEMIQTIPALKNIFEAKTYVQNCLKSGLPADEITTGLQRWPDLPPIKIEAAAQKPPRPESSVDSILDMVDLPDATAAAAVAKKGGESQLQDILQQILKEVFLNDTFRTLEASWRGLKQLMHGVSQNPDMTLEIVPIHLDTLEQTIEALTPHLLETTPSMLLVDLVFGSSSLNLRQMDRIARLAETLMIPAIANVGPEFFHLSSWRDLNKLAFLPHYLQEASFSKWQRLKQSAAARWLALPCNAFLIRYPYGSENSPRRVAFDEQQLLWANPVWALGCLIAQSVTKTGWPTRFTEWQQIRVEDLPLHAVDPHTMVPTEMHLDRNRLDQIIHCGLIPLTNVPNKDIVFAPSDTTVGGSALRYQLLVSRLTHLILWCRDHLPRDMPSDALEAELRLAFTRFWEICGQTGPERLDISVGESDSENRIPISIVLQPARKILSSEEKVELTFLW